MVKIKFKCAEPYDIILSDWPTDEGKHRERERESELDG